MDSARGRANHCIYLTRLLLGAWRRDLAAEDVPAATLSQAYLPAVRAHLARAYGWFLLEIVRPDPMPAAPPGRCAELPAVAAGRALPGEVREFAQLETSGWIGDMLAADGAGPAAAPTTGADTLAATAAFIGPAQAAQWADSLQSLFDRMGDSLDEY